jgi:predicted RNA-binding protein Jag
LKKVKTAYIGYGMKRNTHERQQEARTAANSSAAAEAKAAADQKVLASLPPEDRKLVESLLQDYPELSAEKALAMLSEAGM